MLDPDDRPAAKGTLCAQAPRVQLARFNEGDHGLLSTRTGRSSTSTGCRATVRVATEPPPEPPCYGLPALDGLTPTEAAARPKEDRVEYVQMKDPTATPNKNAKQTAAQNLALPM